MCIEAYLLAMRTLTDFWSFWVSIQSVWVAGFGWYWDTWCWKFKIRFGRLTVLLISYWCSGGQII